MRTKCGYVLSPCSIWALSRLEPSDPAAFCGWVPSDDPAMGTYKTKMWDRTNLCVDRFVHTCLDLIHGHIWHCCHWLVKQANLPLVFIGGGLPWRSSRIDAKSYRRPPRYLERVMSRQSTVVDIPSIRTSSDLPAFFMFVLTFHCHGHSHFLLFRNPVLIFIFASSRHEIPYKVNHRPY